MLHSQLVYMMFRGKITCYYENTQNYTSINFSHGKFNSKFLMNPWQYEHGVCNHDNNDASQFCKGKELVVMAN